VIGKGELEPQVNGFVNQLANMRTEYRNWIATYNRNVNESVEILHPKIDYAFEQLNELTKKLLNCTDEQINAPDDALPTNEPKRQLLDALNTIRSAFHSLSETAAAGLEKAGKYTQEAFVKEHNFFNFKESVTNLEGTLQSERLQCESTCCSYDREFSSAQNELRGIENRLSDYDNLVRCFNFSHPGSVENTNYVRVDLSNSSSLTLMMVGTVGETIKGNFVASGSINCISRPRFVARSRTSVVP
jgi:hypothetical protein